MTTEENMDILRRLANVINSGDLTGLDELVDDKIRYRTVDGREMHGLDEYKQLLSINLQAFPDFEVSIEEMAAVGNNKVFKIWKITGTHEGDYLGIPPTDRKVELLISTLDRFEGGKLVDQFDFFDNLTLLKQLGAVSEEVRPDGEEWPTGGAKLRPQR